MFKNYNINTTLTFQWITADMYSIFGSFHQLYFALRLFGFAPYKIYQNIASASKTISYSTSFLILYILAFIVATFMGKSRNDTNDSLLILYGPYLLYLLHILNTTFTVVFNYLKRKEIVRCMHVIHQFDCMFLQVGHEKGRMENNDVI